MSDSRLPAHLEIDALRRRIEGEGGFVTVLSKGERDAGTILLVVSQRGAPAQLLERMPNLDGPRTWTVTREQDFEKPHDFSEYLARRGAQDADCWILEVDVADPPRFIESLAG